MLEFPSKNPQKNNLKYNSSSFCLFVKSDKAIINTFDRFSVDRTMKNNDKVCVSLFYLISRTEKTIQNFKSFYLQKKLRKIDLER